MRTPRTPKTRRARHLAAGLAALSLVIPSVALAADGGTPAPGPAPAPAPAAAHAVVTTPIAHTPPATVPAVRPGCAATASVMDYRRYAKKVYDRDRISRDARRQLRTLERCQPSAKDRRAVKRHRARYQRVREATMCSQHNVVACIRDAARRYDVSFAMLMRKARCESGLNPYATNGAHDGLFQFRTAAPSTWATTPYAGRSPWKAKWNARAAAWMHAQGRGAEWQCQ
jgi:hypothetical protein